MTSAFLEKLFLAGAGTVFFLVAVFHLLRIVYQWPLVVGSTEVPFLISYSGLPSGLGGAALAFWLLRRKAKRPS